MEPTPGPDPVAALLALADAAARGTPVAPAVGAWLAQGVRVYLRGDTTLERALRLSGERWSAPTVHRYRERNEALRTAAHHLDNNATALAAEVARFESRRWPCWRTMEAAPERASALEVALFNAFAVGVPVPKSAKQLARIIGRAPKA
jgi:hypothetical protein